MSISLKTHKMLWGRSGSRCAFPECKKILIEDKTDTDNESLIGEEAHIVAKCQDGPRGKSELNLRERDSYDNLILLCKNHHKIIDDQPKKYTVEFLYEIKKKHIEWVKQSLKIDENKQKDLEIYASYIDKWNNLANTKNWRSWTSFILSDGLPSIGIKQYNKLKELNNYIFSRIWPKRYMELETAFNNFGLVLNDFIDVFSKYRERTSCKESYYFTEKFYKRLNKWDPETFNVLSKKFDYHVDLVQDLMCELTRAGNYLCDQIRDYISPSYRRNEGILLVESGPYMDFKFRTLKLEYFSKKKNGFKYPGLKKFMTIRKERNIYFGEGVSEDYFIQRL
jgi:hypothetical protein